MFSIRYCDGTTVSLIAGGPGDTTFEASGVCGLVCRTNGDILYATDNGCGRLLSIDPKTRTVNTVYSNPAGGTGTGTRALAFPNELCFDRSPLVAVPESVLFVATRARLRRFDIKTGTGRPIFLPAPHFDASILFVCVCAETGSVDVMLIVQVC